MKTNNTSKNYYPSHSVINITQMNNNSYQTTKGSAYRKSASIKERFLSCSKKDNSLTDYFNLSTSSVKLPKTNTTENNNCYSTSARTSRKNLQNINVYYNVFTSFPKKIQNKILIQFNNYNKQSNKSLNKDIESSYSSSSIHNKKEKFPSITHKNEDNSDNSTKYLQDLSFKKIKSKKKKIFNPKRSIQSEKRVSIFAQKFLNTVKRKSANIKKIPTLNTMTVPKTIMHSDSKQNRFPNVEDINFDSSSSNDSDSNNETNSVSPFDEKEENYFYIKSELSFFKSLENDIKTKLQLIEINTDKSKITILDKCSSFVGPIYNDFINKNRNKKTKSNIYKRYESSYLKIIQLHYNDSHKFVKMLIKLLTEIRMPLYTFNQHYIQCSLIDRYFKLDIYQKVFNDRTFEHKKNKKTYRIKKSKTTQILITGVEEKEIREEQKRIKKLLDNPFVINLTHQDQVYYNLFLFNDNPEDTSIQLSFEQIKKVNIISISPRKRARKAAISKNIKTSLNNNRHKDTEIKIKRVKTQIKRDCKKYDTIPNKYSRNTIDIKPFNDSLMNNNFIQRKSTTLSKTVVCRKFCSEKKVIPHQKFNVCPENYYESCGGCSNKANVISRTFDIKYQLLQSLQKKEDHGDTLFFFIKDGNYNELKNEFNKKKPDIDIKDSNGNTMLNLAVQSQCKKIVMFLLNNGANPNIANDTSNTPLHYALSHHNFEIVDLLLKKGADENIPNKNGITPWQCLNFKNSIL